MGEWVMRDWVMGDGRWVMAGDESGKERQETEM
jgi:hypothetical protein